MSYATKKDLYAEVTQTVIEALEKGDIIWHRPWHAFGFPKNYLTGKAYRGWNLFFLNFITLQRNYSTPYFLTFKQAQSLGGTVKKGAKGTPIIYWATVEDKSALMIGKDEVSEAEHESKATKLIPNRYTIFNLDQTEGINLSKIEVLLRSQTSTIEACEAIVAGMPEPPLIQWGGEEAYYVPSSDTITLPHQKRFTSEEGYFATLFHELAHSTGHPKRLNRKELVALSGFGSESYSKEELTAEFTSAFLCGTAGIQSSTIQNSAAYIKGWLKTLKEDKRLLLQAASQAQKAADYILNSNMDLR